MFTLYGERGGRWSARVDGSGDGRRNNEVEWSGRWKEERNGRVNPLADAPCSRREKDAAGSREQKEKTNE